jgi:pilus assembly protein CpaB
MNKNVVIVMVGGLLIAILVAVLVQATLGGKKQAPVVVEKVKTVKILVAKDLVKAGDKASKETLRWETWPETAVFPGAIVRDGKQTPEEAVQGTFLRSVEKDQPVTKDVVANDANTRFLAASLAKGMRAYSVQVKPESMVSGFMGPGDYVDVVLTYDIEVEVQGLKEAPELQNYVNSQVQDVATETVLQNIKVLGIDQGAMRQEDGLAKIGRTVTLEVTLQQAEVLALAQDMGKLSFALRRLGDEEIVSADRRIVTDVRMTALYRQIVKGLVTVQSEGLNNNSAANADSIAVDVPANVQFGSSYSNSAVKVYSDSGVQSVTVDK